MKAARLCSIVFIALALVLSVGSARATLTLSDGNSVASIDPTSSSGMYNWTVDGISQLYQQWFWYGVGAGGDYSLNTLSAPSIVQVGSNQATITYKDTTTDPTAGLQVAVTYLLSGGALHSGESDMSEIINIENNSGHALDLHFFQYSDFDLDGTPNNQNVAISLDSTGKLGIAATQTSALGSLSETADSPYASRWEANTYASTLNNLESTPGYRLNDAVTASGDATWAFEWDKTISAGGSLLISKDKHLAVYVPEPATILGLGAILLVVGRKLRTRLGA